MNTSSRGEGRRMDRLTGLPPGSILQLLHLERRLKPLTPGFFVEVGPGSGDITALLLSLGWAGRVYDLHQPTIERLSSRFTEEIAANRLELNCEDFIKSTELDANADLFISCMVVEHIPKHHIKAFWRSVNQLLTDTGLVISLVPGSPNHWGIEDDIAGHIERFSFASLVDEMEDSGFKPQYTCGLTYPISNWLLPLSNYLVAKSEKSKESLSLKQRTALSGAREVSYKTHFPKIAHLILNRWAMKPFDILQGLFPKSKSSLVIYQESNKGKR